MSALIFFVLIGVVFDLVSCVLEIKKNRVESGPSGLHIFTLIVFYLLPMLLVNKPLVSASVFFDCLIFSVFHFFMVIFIPSVDGFFFGGQRK